METRYAKRIAVIVVILIVIVVVGIGALVWTVSFKGDTTSEAKVLVPQATRRIIHKQFQQLRKDMLYSVVVRILGFEGQRVSEVRLDNFKTFVTYRWMNSDGSMVVIGFRRLDSSGDADVMFADSMSSVGLTE